MGSIKDLNAKFYTSKEFTWSDSDIELLGVKITNGCKQLSKDYDLIIEKASKVLNMWQTRNLTVLGRGLVVNTLIGSLFVYKMQVYSHLSKDQERKLKQVMNSYGKANGQKLAVLF